MPIRKLSCLLIPALLGLSAVPQGRAQTASDPRFAFADTTLLRDTLGIRFERLFELAESLRITPDTLRALSIRLGFPPTRMVFLADSLRVRVDSVGSLLERELFNPLAATATKNVFTYNTSYNVQQTQSTWSNTSDYSLGWRQLFLRNQARIQMSRFQSSGRTSIRQTRNSTTEAGLRLSKDYSVGGRAVLNRFDSNDPSSIQKIGETQGDYQLSVRTRQRPRAGLSTEINLFSGMLDLQNSRLDKRGVTGEVNGRLQHTSGDWFVHDMAGQVNANLSRTVVPSTRVSRNTRDALGNVNGTLNLFDQAPLGFNGTYAYQRSNVNAPDNDGQFRAVRSNTADLQGTMRSTFGGRGVAHVGGTYSLADRLSALSGPSTRRANGILADGTYDLYGFTLEGAFNTSFAKSELPQADSTGGYGEDLTERSLNGTITRTLFRRVNARLNARIGLARYRYRTIGSYLTLPVSRDQVQQNYRAEANYASSGDFSSGISLDVSRTQSVNLPSASTSTNNTTRVYRGEWRWTYKLMRGLTATQRNTLGATYVAYNFIPENDRLLLEYGTVTTLNAILSPRLNVDLTHNSRVQPGGNYTLQDDGLYYFRPADRSKYYSLSTRVGWTPIPAFSLQIEPSYQSSRREGASGGVLAPQREDRTLNFAGNSSLNLKVGRKGLLTGTIGRTFFSTGSTTFTSTATSIAPASEFEYWNGTLNFSWRL
jgi:hypothetical protein